MADFKVGDKVRVTETGLGAPYGEEFIITGLVNPDYANRPGQYAQGDRNKSGVWLEYLELVEPVQVLEIGSRVRLEDGTVGVVEKVLPETNVPTRVGAVVGFGDGLPQFVLMHDDPDQDFGWSPWRHIETGSVVKSATIRSYLEDGLVVLWEGQGA